MRLVSKNRGSQFLKKVSIISILFLAGSNLYLPRHLAADIGQDSQSLNQIGDSPKTELDPVLTQASYLLDGMTYQSTSGLELAQLVREGKITSRELVELALEQVAEQNPQLNAVISLRAEAALKEADNLTDTGQPFLGVPLLLKGLGQTLKGESNTNGFIFSKDQVSGGTSAFVKGLQAAGFIIIGQTNFPELGLKNITDSKLYGPARNPWNPAYQAGGSSGGAAASLAAGMVPVTSGSDAGGSIRIPAAWTGTIGLKPSRGVLIGNSPSEKGQAVHFALTRTMADTSTLFRNLEKEPLPEAPDLTGVTIAYSTKSPVGTPVSSEAVRAVEQAVLFLKDQGFNLVEVDNPIDGVKLMESYYTIGAGSAGIVNFLASQKLHRPLKIDDVDIVTWALAQTSKTVTKEEVAKAWEFNQQAAAEMAEFHANYPLFLTPTTAYPASAIDDPLISPEYANQLAHIEELPAEKRLPLIYDQWLESLTLTPFTQQANLTGEPAISLPTYITDSGLPMGVQFNAGRGQDKLLLEIGELFESNHQFKLLHTKDDPTDPEPNEGESESNASEGESEPNTSESEPSEGESEPNTSESEPSEGESQPNPSDPELNEGESEPNTSESEPSEGESQPNPSDPEPSESESESNASDPELNESESEPNATDPEPSEGESESNVTDPELSEGESEPNASDPEPSEGESEPNASESEPSEGESEPNATDPEPSESESEPNASDPEPSEGESEPNASESEPSEGESEPNASAPEPSESESEPNLSDPERSKKKVSSEKVLEPFLQPNSDIVTNQFLNEASSTSSSATSKEQGPSSLIPKSMTPVKQIGEDNQMKPKPSLQKNVTSAVTKDHQVKKSLPQTGEKRALLIYIVGLTLVSVSMVMIKRN